MPWDCFACLKPTSNDIKQLNYEHCTLNDVPLEVFAFERTLEELYLDSNRIRDLPRPLFHCHGLKVLSLSDNEVHSLPPAVASLINLQYLNVSRNALNSIPDNLKGCKHLTYVDVSLNPLEKLPEGFTQLISLEELYLNDTYLDFLPANFGRLMRLKILELRENNLNTLPKSIARLTHLQRLDIGQNDFSDVPEVVGSLPNLTELWIDSNRIKCIPPLIGNLKKLLHLEASNNNIRSVASEIENCVKLVDLSLSGNELVALPNSLGNLKELVTLKLDDNQISILPNTIGKLSNLEELILSQNDLESLPPCVGLLRKLHILNVDDNMLEELPPEMGSCTRLTILSAHSNKLQHVPGELGHLSNLHVINLSENQLQNLPVSILNLVQLNALWLSNNQSTPLTTLQQELDKQTGQMVCTNFMLPQSTQETPAHESYSRRQEVPGSDQTVKAKPHITFAAETDVEAPSRLLRAPTPYPKELRAMAKHARAIHHTKKPAKESDEDTPLLDEMVSQEPQDVLIKEAKVKKPSTEPLGNISLTQSYEKVVNILENSSEYNGYMDNNVLENSGEAVYSNSLGEMSIVMAMDSGPVVREAKCVRKTSLTANVIANTEPRQRESFTSNQEQSFHQPPPYHIAAAYSKQAVFFMQNGVSAGLSPQTEDTRNKVTIKEMDEGKEQLSDWEVDSNQSNLFPKADKITSINSFVLPSTEGPKEYEKSNLNTTDAEPRSLQKDENTEENISNEVTFLSVSPTVADTNSNLHNEDHIVAYESSGVTETNKTSVPLLHEFVVDIKEEVKNEMNSEENVVEMEVEVLENCAESHISDLSSKIEFDQPEEDGSEPHFMQEPQTFTQDKPVVSEGVVAPTPQRPRTSGIPKATVRTPASVAFATPYKLQEEDQKEEQMIEQKHSLNYEGKLPQSFERKCKEDTWQPPTSPSSTKIPVPCFHSPKGPNTTHKKSPMSNYPSPDNSMTHAQATNSLNEVDQNFLNATHTVALTDSNLNLPSNVSNHIDAGSVENGNYSDGPSSLNERHTGISKIPVLGASSDLGSPKPFRIQSGPQTRIPAPTNVSSSLLIENMKFGENQHKHPSKTWMFGPHRNATVFPVTIQKNPGLGFSISGGVKTPSSPERFENEIIVTKVHPGGPANGQIMPGDKILEVDGIDFTKLEHDQAVLILKQTGNVVNMMISRQQI